ncbi:MAG: AMP-binding protein [Deltaproteobacteria bacterium]|nr:AMP-binding protein [Candidatus Zymogenaceae bacterium]
MDDTVIDNLAKSAGAHPGKPAIFFKGNRLTYRELDELSNSLANALTYLGVTTGDRVAVMMPNLPQTIISYYAILKAGAAMIGLNPESSTSEISRILTNSRTGVVIGLERDFERLLSIKDKTGIKHLILTNIRRFYPKRLRFFKEYIAKTTGYFSRITYEGDIHNFSTLINHHPKSKPEVRITPEDTAVIQYTGGITGVSKGAQLTHRNIATNVEQVALWFKGHLTKDDRFIAAAPYNHLYGMTMALDLPIRLGASIIVMNKFTPEKFEYVITKDRPTFFPAIPAMYRSLIHSPIIEKLDFSTLKLSMSAAAPLNESTRESFRRITGVPIIEGYGLAEASGLTHINPASGKGKPGTIGLPLPGTDAQVVNLLSGKGPLAPNESGELTISGPQVMHGYWAMPDETADTVKNGSLFTGDIAVMDGDGYFRLEERKKNIIFVGENRVYHREVEDVLMKHYLVVDAAVIGIPDELTGEAVKAFVVLEEGKALSGKDIISYCRANLSPFKTPVEVEFLREMNKTADGKVILKDMAD